MSFQLVITADGSHTLFVPELNEHYHSVNGALRESLIVYLGNGYNYSTANPLSILEIGFGTGLNALLTYMRSSSDRRYVNYTAIEKYPLDNATLWALNHPSITAGESPQAFQLIHNAGWNIAAKLSEFFVIRKIEADFVTDPVEGRFDLVYFDAFGPDKQPEMWKEELFMKIYSALNDHGVLVTYSAKGTVKRALKGCGFDVELLPGPPGKRQVLRAVKKNIK